MTSTQNAGPEQVRKFCGMGGCSHYQGTNVCTGLDSREMQELAVEAGECIVAMKKIGKRLHSGRMIVNDSGIGIFLPTE